MDKDVEDEKQDHRVNAMTCQTLAWEVSMLSIYDSLGGPPISSPLFEVWVRGSPCCCPRDHLVALSFTPGPGPSFTGGLFPTQGPYSTRLVLVDLGRQEIGDGADAVYGVLHYDGHVGRHVELDRGSEGRGLG